MVLRDALAAVRREGGSRGGSGPAGSRSHEPRGLVSAGEDAAAIAALEGAAKALDAALLAMRAAGWGSHITEPVQDALAAVNWALREVR